ncbi:MAG: J domain-containing protein [Hyphomonadaceae bacterium]|nr:J domain-containing protein [Hyphomonadaceae bacterium]
MNEVNAYPLSWPEGWKRSGGYRVAAFRVGNGNSARRVDIGTAVKRVLLELERMGVQDGDVIISTNIRPTLTGRLTTESASDPGVAVYWQTRNKSMRVIAVDLYNRVADNLCAIAASLDAMRAIERHGGAVVMDRAFTGFTALPPPVERERPWWEVLGVSRDASPDEIRAAWRAGAAKFHPDKPGGSHDAVAAINAARDKALAERTLK